MVPFHMEKLTVLGTAANWDAWIEVLMAIRLQLKIQPIFKRQLLEKKKPGAKKWYSLFSHYSPKIKNKG